MPYSVKGFFEIDEDMVQILLVLEVLFTQDSEVEDLFCGASSGSEPSLFFSNYFFSLGFKPILSLTWLKNLRTRKNLSAQILLKERHIFQSHNCIFETSFFFF